MKTLTVHSLLHREEDRDVAHCLRSSPMLLAAWFMGSTGKEAVRAT